jgi:CRP-like cAMP-binding protein
MQRIDKGAADQERNRLLALLPDEDKVLLAPLLEHVDLAQGDVLHEPFGSISHVYFFKSGLSSEIAINPGGNQIEIGCIGKEGLSGLPVVLDVEATPHRSFMEVGGSALRIRSTELRRLFDASTNIRATLLRYVHVFTIQIASTALSHGKYSLSERLARWLLMAHDRLESDQLPLTHDFLSLMLGVRRSGVTDAIHVLEGELAIRAKRGLITVRSRGRLEKIAGDSYGVAEAEYRRILEVTQPV